MEGVETGTAWPLALLMGIVYLVGGLLWLLASLGLPVPFPAIDDSISAAVLVVVAAVFLSGVGPLRQGDREGLGFIAVGVLLAGIMFALQLVILSTSFLGWTLGLEDWISWNLAMSLTPTVWLFLLVILFLAVGRMLEGNREGGFTKYLLGG